MANSYANLQQDKIGGCLFICPWGPLPTCKVCLRSAEAFVITCVANLMEVIVLYVQQDLRYEMSSYLRFNV
jgi:hypothetical protein